jgi:HTH-type transcriptional regulator / antitoxin HigA
VDKKMEIKPVRNSDDYNAALKEVDQLLEAEPGTPEFDRLDVLTTLIVAYENAHDSIPLPDDPVEVLKYYMESRGITRAELIPFLGSKERVSEILNQKRSLSLEMIRRLHAGLGIPTDLLIGSSGRKTPRDSSRDTRTNIRP